MDINQFEWDVLEKKMSFRRATLMRGMVLGPVLIAVCYGAYYLGMHQHQFNTNELIAMLEILAVMMIVLINFVWHWLYMVTPPKLVHYKLSSEGVSRDKKKYGLSFFKSTEVDTYLAKNALPYQQWRQPRPFDGALLGLTFNTSQGRAKIEFPEEYVRQKFIRTFQEYLHPTIGTNQSI